MIKTGFKNAFTLAEVLTTLMVIGVVAAMTIPTLLNSTDEQQYKVAFKKSLAVLSQAVQLNIAKGEECNITNSKTLCDCMAKSMAGTCLDEQTTGSLKYSTLTTPDGMSFMFVLKGSASDRSATAFTDVCGTTAPSTEAGWQGKGFGCLVMVDVNGLSKGTKSMASSAFGNTTSGLSNAVGLTTVKDQLPVILTGAGVYPAITNATKKYGHLGYDYMYGTGSNVTTPWSVSSYFSDATD